MARHELDRVAGEAVDVGVEIKIALIDTIGEQDDIAGEDVIALEDGGKEGGILNG